MILSRKGKGIKGPDSKGLVLGSRAHLGMEAVTMYASGLGARDGDLHLTWHQLNASGVEGMVLAF